MWLKEEKIGVDRLYILGGGERPHVGSVVVGEPGKDIITVRLGTHYDYLILEPIAREASEKYKVTCVAVGGIHIDNASKAEIEIIVRNCKELVTCI
ncbi:MAG: hypothetical protein HXS52_01850 [Theionarchaea archaeon]|nr:hypothetical protein [Theionarchaea archaeon]MBU7036648.1 hypothetical protein [Theionarchaea archaeon]